MQFTESVRTCFSQYASFGGRASRPEFWWWALFCVIATLVLGVVSDKLSAAFSLATLLPYIAVTTRRLHDTDRSGWWQLLFFLPVIGWLVMLYWLVQPSESSSGY